MKRTNTVTLYVDKDLVNIYKASLEMYETLRDIRKFVLGVDALGPTDSQIIAAKCWLAIAKAENERV